jgi:transposase
MLVRYDLLRGVGRDRSNRRQKLPLTWIRIEIRVDENTVASSTGVFTIGIVATMQGRQIAPYFTGPKHAGENLADVLKRRPRSYLPLIQMSDALVRSQNPLRALNQ